MDGEKLGRQFSLGSFSFILLILCDFCGHWGLDEDTSRQGIRESLHFGGKSAASGRDDVVFLR